VSHAATQPIDAATTPGCGEGEMVLRQTLTITNSRGLHARAAAKLVTLAERFSASASRMTGRRCRPAPSWG
jgi:phosphocarrier protein HPr